MALMAASNGLLLAYIPVHLNDAGAPAWVAGTMVTSLALGSFIGCFFVTPLIRRVGHARTFLAFAALNVLHAEMIAFSDAAWIWCIARAVYGVSAVGFFIVSQSWLNDVCSNAWRGRVTSIFYMSYVVMLGVGSYGVGWIEPDPSTVALACVGMIALAMIPIGLTRLQPTPPSGRGAIDLRRVWRISPVGFAGLLAAGGVSMLIQGFAPIYGAEQGYDRSDVGLLILVMQLGLIGVQLPLGILSDRIDRRYVLIAASFTCAACAFFALGLDGGALTATMIAFAVWVGVSESIYAVAGAHANDRADPSEYVMVASTLLFLWSFSAFVVPFVVTILTGLFGMSAFMVVTACIAAAYAAFVGLRMTRREAAPDDAQEPYRAAGAQAPLTADMAPASEAETAP